MQEIEDLWMVVIQILPKIADMIPCGTFSDNLPLKHVTLKTDTTVMFHYYYVTLVSQRFKKKKKNLKQVICSVWF